jgi:hypothetical protein
MQGRANLFLVRGVYSKIWAPFHSRAPLKNFFQKAKMFPENVVPKIFLPQKFPKSFANNSFPEIFILHFLKILQFYHVRAPSPQVGPPFFTFLGVLHSPHPPGGTALSSYN